MIRAIGIAGSLRSESYNRKALQEALEILRVIGAEAREVDLKENPLPFYNQDIEDAGMPPEVAAFRAEIERADILVFACPEYNYSISAVLKNAIDWASRQGNPLGGKVAAVFGASTGRLGTARMQPHLRRILQAVNMTVVPQPEVYISSAEDAFGSDGRLRDERVRSLLQKLMARAFETALNNVKER